MQQKVIIAKNVAPSEHNKTLNSENFKNSIRTNCQQPDQEAHVGLNYLFSFNTTPYKKDGVYDKVQVCTIQYFPNITPFCGSIFWEGTVVG